MTAETLADASPPKAMQANVDLPTATVGSPYRTELPSFADPGGKGLRLTASGLPEGLTFSDLGGGNGAIEGVPQQATSASIRIVATNHHDRTAQMSAALVVSDKPAPPPGPVANARDAESGARAEAVARPGLSPTCSAAAVDGSASRHASAVSTDGSGRSAGGRGQNTALASPPPVSPKQQTVGTLEAPPPQALPPAPGATLSRPWRPSRRKKRLRRLLRALTGESASLSSRVLEQPNRTNIRASARRSNRSAASIRPTSARSASRLI